MKTTEKFTKIMLVFIAALLVINILKTDQNEFSLPFIAKKVEAASPAFIQVGKTYDCVVDTRPNQNYEILQIDKDNGWIETRWTFPGYESSGQGWFNLSHFQSCKLVK